MCWRLASLVAGCFRGVDGGSGALSFWRLAAGRPPPLSLPSPLPSPNCEVAARPRGDPEQLLGNLGKGRGRGGGEDEFPAQNAAALTLVLSIELAGYHHLHAEALAED